MTQKEEIKALREEVAELRKQITALLDVERIIARQPQMIPYPVYPQPYQPYPMWPNRWINQQPTITVTSGQISSGAARNPLTVWNTGASAS